MTERVFIVVKRANKKTPDRIQKGECNDIDDHPGIFFNNKETLPLNKKLHIKRQVSIFIIVTQALSVKSKGIEHLKPQHSIIFNFIQTMMLFKTIRITKHFKLTQTIACY